MKIYISGPMKGIKDHNHPEFNRVAADLRAKGYRVINPAEIEQPDLSHAACMRQDIKEMIMGRADTLALLNGWKTSKGARGEIFIADLLGMKIINAYTLEPIALHVEVSINPLIQEGDTVHHRPYHENWYVLGVNHERGELCAAGWPPTVAKIADCSLIEKGNGITEDELKYRNSTFGSGWEEHDQ